MKDYIKKVCFYGPESTGKSFFSKRMAALYNTAYVPEVARELITTNEFSLDDIIAIGRAQTQRVFDTLKTANKILFCDTDVITTQLYSQIYLNAVPPILYELEKQVTYDLYFLFSVDIPWVADGLRDLGHRREEIFNVFKNALDKRAIKYVLVHGDGSAREKIVIDSINALLAQPFKM